MAQGDLSGLNYEIPQYQPRMGAQMSPAQNPQAAYAPPSLGNSPLADREGQTQELFDNYALLNSFAKDMASKGIDVFTPDYSQPGGGLAYQTYLKLDASVRFASNKLAVQQKAQDQFLPKMYENEVGLAKGRTMQNVDLTDPNQILRYNPTAATKEAGERLAQQTNTTSASNAVNNAVYNPAMAAIEQRRQAGELSDEQAAIEASYLLRNTPDPQVFPPRAETQSSKTAQGNLAYLKALTNQAAGNWAKGSYTRTVIDGKPWDVSTRETGEQLGETTVNKEDALGNVTPTIVKIITKDWIKDPETGEVFLRFTDPSIPIKKVDKYSGEDVAVSSISSNQRRGGGSAIPDLYNLMRESGYLDESNRLIPDTQVTNPEIGTSEPDEFTSKLDNYFAKTKDRVITLLQQVKDPESKTETARFKAPKGQVDFRYSDKKGFYVENWEDVPGLTKQPTQMGEKQIMTLLSNLGYWENINNAYRTGQYQEGPKETPEERKARLQKQFNLKK